MWVVNFDGESIDFILLENLTNLTFQKPIEVFIFVSLGIQFRGEVCWNITHKLKEKYGVLESPKV